MVLVLRTNIHSLQLYCYLVVDALAKLLHAHYSLFATTLLTHSHCTVSSFLLTNDNHIRNTLNLVVAHLTSYLLITIVNYRTYAYGSEVVLYLFCIVVIFL